MVILFGPPRSGLVCRTVTPGFSVGARPEPMAPLCHGCFCRLRRPLSTAEPAVGMPRHVCFRAQGRQG
eukprot:5430670-Lingulodinium_polyedra.AAC.1